MTTNKKNMKRSRVTTEGPMSTLIPGYRGGQYLLFGTVMLIIVYWLMVAGSKSDYLQEYMSQSRPCWFVIRKRSVFSQLPSSAALQCGFDLYVFSVNSTDAKNLFTRCSITASVLVSSQLREREVSDKNTPTADDINQKP